ncbi:hypothetical protein PV664_37070 [Streptomyces sp. ME01-18a]|uniref:hypothetical protein n=1 Tax=Streptomyces sp. ME01-18a TaxID=3028669 RepID=UPI0029BEDC85|nr:hypothetical protein [Streptomyces sp. ME01-18a]MDX3434408.1 hypothetical protein [Streptomyces sp. ME01-18a]
MTPGQQSTPRTLTEEEYELAYTRLTAIAHRNGSRLSRGTAHEALAETLAAIGVFTPAPEPEPDTCTALYLPHDTEEFGPDVFGAWQQCGDDPGHDGTDHDSGEVRWNDLLPGAVPAIQ